MADTDDNDIRPGRTYRYSAGDGSRVPLEPTRIYRDAAGRKPVRDAAGQVRRNVDRGVGQVRGRVRDAAEDGGVIDKATRQLNKALGGLSGTIDKAVREGKVERTFSRAQVGVDKLSAFARKRLR